jgi:glycine hydroxymethyltransferase
MAAKMFPREMKIDGYDSELANAIAAERQRQEDHVELIASENYASPRVLEAQGSVLTNKYSEGYPAKRYYGGNLVVDEAEVLARDRLCELFGAEHANVQPHSGANANMAAFLALLDPGDKVMGMRLDQGGHLTHGSPVNFSGRLYRFVAYGVDDETETLDYDAVAKIAAAERPKVIVAGATADPRLIDFAAFRAIADDVGATLLVDAAHIAGLVAGGAHPTPVGHADVISTTTHKTLRGPRGAMLMSTEEHASAIDRAVFPGLQGGPHNHTTAAIAVALEEASRLDFSDYAHQVVANAKALAAALSDRGFDLVSGGTDNHLILVDLRSKDVPGKPAAQALDRARITTNYNMVPFDPRKPFDPSGIRIGTPAVTTRGMKEPEMETIAGWIDAGVDAAKREDDEALTRLGAEVRELALQFPIPGL